MAMHPALEKALVHFANAYEEISTYTQEANQLVSQLNHCDKYEQDLLHMAENLTLNAAESAKVFRELRENRKQRRTVKNDLKIEQSIRPLLEQFVVLFEQLQQNAQLRPSSYTLRTDKAANFLQNLSTRSILSTVPFVEPQTVKVIPQNIEHIAARLTKKDAVETYDYEIVRTDKWTLLQHGEIIHQTSKLKPLLQFIIEHRLYVVINGEHYTQAHNLFRSIYDVS